MGLLLKIPIPFPPAPHLCARPKPLSPGGCRHALINVTPSPPPKKNLHPTHIAGDSTTIPPPKNPVDCDGVWGFWGPCSKTCGSGAWKRRTYTVLTPAENGGNACPYRTGQDSLQSCNKPCPTTAKPVVPSDPNDGGASCPDGQQALSYSYGPPTQPSMNGKYTCGADAVRHSEVRSQMSAYVWVCMQYRDSVRGGGRHCACLWRTRSKTRTSKHNVCSLPPTTTVCPPRTQQISARS